jgi:hypothetical protein
MFLKFKVETVRAEPLIRTRTCVSENRYGETVPGVRITFLPPYNLRPQGVPLPDARSLPVVLWDMVRKLDHEYPASFTVVNSAVALWIGAAGDHGTSDRDGR